MSWLLLGLMVLSAVAGVVVHELCHWLVARAFGRDARLRWLANGPEAVWPVDTLRWYDHLAMIAPQIAGVAALVAAFALSWWPIWAIPGWIMLTLNGSRTDFTPLYAAIGRDIDPTSETS